MTDWSPRRIAFTKDDGLPKYVAIARALALAITEQELRPGDMLPPQKDLAESFGVTIMTVRQALQTLSEQGLVMIEHGKGTFVRSQPYPLALGPLASFASQIRATGRSLRTEVLGSGPVDISPMEQKRMRLTEPRAFELVRLRIVDGEPLILQCSLLPQDIAEQLDIGLLAEKSLYEMLWTSAIHIARATETVQAVDLDEESARVLRRQPHEAALLSARLTFTREGRAVVDDRALTAGDSVVVRTDRQVAEHGLDLQLAEGAPIQDPQTPFLRRSTEALR